MQTEARHRATTSPKRGRDKDSSDLEASPTILCNRIGPPPSFAIGLGDPIAFSILLRQSYCTQKTCNRIGPSILLRHQSYCATPVPIASYCATPVPIASYCATPNPIANYCATPNPPLPIERAGSCGARTAARRVPPEKCKRQYMQVSVAGLPRSVASSVMCHAPTAMWKTLLQHRMNSTRSRFSHLTRNLSV